MYISLKKEIDKIYKKIDKIAKEGKDNYQEYYDYFNDLISKGKYGILTQVLLIKYNFDYIHYLSSDEVKHKSWDAIRYNTNTSFLENKNKLLKEYSLYQTGLDYYTATYSVKLGKIVEVDVYAISIENKLTDPEFQKLIHNRTTYLEATKLGYTQSATFSTWDITYKYDKNLINLYREALTYLI